MEETQAARGRRLVREYRDNPGRVRGAGFYMQHVVDLAAPTGPPPGSKRAKENARVVADALKQFVGWDLLRQHRGAYYGARVRPRLRFRCNLTVARPQSAARSRLRSRSRRPALGQPCRRRSRRPRRSLRRSPLRSLRQLPLPLPLPPRSPPRCRRRSARFLAQPPQLSRHRRLRPSRSPQRRQRRRSPRRTRKRERPAAALPRCSAAQRRPLARPRSRLRRFPR